MKIFLRFLESKCFAADKGTQLPGGIDDESEDDLGVDDDDMDNDLGPIDDDEDEEEVDIEDSLKDKDDDDEEEKPDSTTAATGTKKVISMTQEDLDRIINERLARDRKVREDQENQRVQQEQQTQQFNQWYQSQLTEQTKFYADTMGLDEETAEKLAKRDVDKEVRILQAEQIVRQNQEFHQLSQKETKYIQDKADRVGKNPLIAKYIKEIDQFSQNGKTGIDFDVAANYVLGAKVMNGELINSIKTTTEQKTLKNVGQRSKIAVEKGGSAKADPALSKQEMKLAAALGVSPKAWAASKKGKK